LVTTGGCWGGAVESGGLFTTAAAAGGAVVPTGATLLSATGICATLGCQFENHVKRKYYTMAAASAVRRNVCRRRAASSPRLLLSIRSRLRSWNSTGQWNTLYEEIARALRKIRYATGIQKIKLKMMVAAITLSIMYWRMRPMVKLVKSEPEFDPLSPFSATHAPAEVHAPLEHAYTRTNGEVFLIKKHKSFYAQNCAGRPAKTCCR
jgi:hypothetical protein